MFAGEFHALDTASRTASSLLESWTAAGEPCVLAVEFAHARHQRALDAYLEGSIGEGELRRRLRYREEWGYPWSGPRRLLRQARRLGVPVLGLDLSPRGSATDLMRRDRIAAERLAVLAGERPRPPRLVVVIGEAHLSARHLPRELASRWPVAAGALRVVHDVEDLPCDGHGEWAEAASEGWLHRRLRPRRARLPALERIYRRWAEDPMAPTEIDVAMMADGLIEAELRAVGIEPRRRRVEPGRWLPDIYPEVFPVSEPRRVARRLREEGWTRARVRRALDEAAERGALLVPEAGVLLVAGSSVRGLALETGRFGALALRPGDGPRAEVSFWERLATAALGFVLARAVDPTVPAAGPREVITAAERRRQLAPALGSWLGEALERAHREGEIATGTLRRWLAGPLGGSEGAVRWLRRAVRSLGRARV